MPFPRLIISGTQSGVGKTTLTLALCQALRTRGLRVAVFKCGPDYLDPTYHTLASGEVCHNLDGWMMGRDAVVSTFQRVAAQADVALVEGVMGLFDGAEPTSDAGSTAEIAKWLEAPVLLVVDASGMARSIGPIAKGFAAFDSRVHLAGILCNRVGSLGHLDLLGRASQSVPVLGGLPKDTDWRIPERHLGLHSATPDTLSEAMLTALGEEFAAFSGVDRMLEVARQAPAIPTPPSTPRAVVAPKPCRIGLAQDAAFHFYYDDNLRQLEACGATLVPFSPVSDARLPPVDGLYLGGGYPEVHAESLAANVEMRDAIAAFARRGGPVYAECGGLMYLTESITTLDGSLHPMVGLLPVRALMRERLQALGYVEVETQQNSLLGPPGVRFRGHQYRYSELEGADALSCAYSVRQRRSGDTFREGYVHGKVLASYVHAHWASNPVIPERIVAACHAFHQERA